MKIIATDNFGRDTFDDFLVASGVNEFYGNKIVKFLNDTLSGEHSDWFFKLVDDDYKLALHGPM